MVLWDKVMASFSFLNHERLGGWGHGSVVKSTCHISKRTALICRTHTIAESELSSLLIQASES